MQVSGSKRVFCFSFCLFGFLSNHTVVIGGRPFGFIMLSVKYLRLFLSLKQEISRNISMILEITMLTVK